MRLHGRTISQGVALGEALVTHQSISFFGGVDPDSGMVVERGHELEGQSVAGKILVFPTSKGSTVGSYTLYRLKHNGKAPAAIINADSETITAVGCIIAEIACMDQIPLDELHTGQRLLVNTHHNLVEILPPYFGPQAAPIPDWLRGNEAGSFAEATMKRRLPGIARRTAQDEPWPPEIISRLEALAGEMPDTPLRPIDDPGAPDEKRWAAYMAPYVGQTWLDPPWFVAEMYFFRRILEATGYFQEGAGKMVDPYAGQKRHGLQGTREALEPWCERLEGHYAAAPERDQVQEILAQLMRANIWGNQADQSLWPAGSQGPSSPQPGDLSDSLLLDDSDRAARYLVDLKSSQGDSKPGALVDIILDNSGLELAYDLLLADFLLQSGLARQVRLHGKWQPTYVSDVTGPDLWTMLSYFSTQEGGVARMAARLTRALVEDQRLVMEAEPYWNSPLENWRMPGDLWAKLHDADLLISKGDANYRRWVGDRHWPLTTPFEQVIAYRPAPVLVLRVVKAEVITGLAEGKAGEMYRRDPNWLYDGKWGLIQFSG